MVIEVNKDSVETGAAVHGTSNGMGSCEISIEVNKGTIGTGGYA